MVVQPAAALVVERVARTFAERVAALAALARLAAALQAVALPVEQAAVLLVQVLPAEPAEWLPAVVVLEPAAEEPLVPVVAALRLPWLDLHFR